MLAHAGHWLVNLLYVMPVLIVVGYIGVRALLDRRAANAETREPAPPPAGDPPG